MTIANGREVYLHQGSTLNLTCVISPAIDASLLLWSHNGQVRPPSVSFDQAIIGLH